MCKLIPLARDVVKFVFSGNYNRFDTFVVMPAVTVLLVTGYLFFAGLFFVIGAAASVVGEVFFED